MILKQHLLAKGVTLKDSLDNIFAIFILYSTIPGESHQAIGNKSKIA